MSFVVTISLFLKRNPVLSVSTLGDFMAAAEFEDDEEFDDRRPFTTDRAFRTESLTPIASNLLTASLGLM